MFTSPIYTCIAISVNIILFGPRREKTVFGVFDKARPKPVCSATESSKKIEISPESCLHMILYKKANNKGADQTARMRRLFCASVVRKPLKTGFLALRPNVYYLISLHENLKMAPEHERKWLAE